MDQEDNENQSLSDDETAEILNKVHKRARLSSDPLNIKPELATDNEILESEMNEDLELIHNDIHVRRIA